MKVETRVERIQRLIEARHGPGVIFFAAVLCDVCGATAGASSAEALARASKDWFIDPDPPYNDRCPVCR